MQKIDIVNLALARLGEPTINDLREGSEEAAKVHAVWDGALEATLQAYRWGFNVRRKALALQEENPAGYAYAYRYGAPAGMLQPYEIYTAQPEMGRPIPFLFEDQSIFTDEPDAILVYSVREDRCSLFTPAFRDALAWRLAGDLAMALTQRSDFAKLAQQNFNIAIDAAKAMSGNARKMKRKVPRYIQARG